MDKNIDSNALKEISITGDTLSLQIIEKIFKMPRYTVCMKQHGSGNSTYKEYRLTSTLLSTLDNIDSIKEIGHELINEINAICNFVKNDFSPISFDAIYVDQCGYMFFEEKIHMWDVLHIMENGKMSDIDEPQILNISALMECNSLLKNILTILNRKGRDWVNLYRILEMFKGESIDIVEKGWITKKNYRNFMHTANSPVILGEESRHGKQSGEPPNDPMPLSMAQILISSIIWNYIYDCSNNKYNGT